VSDNACARDSLRLTVPNDTAYLPVLLAYVREMAACVGFTGADLHRVELAVEEAATSVIENAFAPGETATFDVVCTKLGAGLEIRVRDKGIPWDPSLEDDYRPDADLDTQTGAGLSGFLIRQLMDEYEFANLGRDGKETRLVKHLPTTLVGVDEPAPPEAEVVTPPATRPDRIAFDVRLMQPNEAIQVARAVFDCYGYSYAGEFAYYPDRLVAMNEDGALRSAVAVARDAGEIGGHCALLFYDSLPTEIGVAVTKQAFRGQGFARQLAELLEQQARDEEVRGLQVKEVTAHPYTQKFSRKLGYRDCGFLLAHSPKTLSFKGIKDQLKQRNSDVIGFKFLTPPAPRELCVPAPHTAFVERIYAELDATVKLTSPSARPEPGAQTLMTASVHSIRALCELMIAQYGEDAVAMLKQELRRVRREEVQVVEMYLRLEDPCTPWFASEAEGLGFFVTGVLPETACGDTLVMQYLNGVQVEYDELVIDQDATRELLDYVRAQDPAMQ